jgi:Flp pilus assembly pilin Flp
MSFNLRAFILDEAGNATSEYALVAGTFAMVMIGTLGLITAAASGQMTFTDTGLDNRNGITP